VTTGLLEPQAAQSHSQIITTNKPTSSFLQARCPSCRPTNSVKALKFWQISGLFQQKATPLVDGS